MFKPYRHSICIGLFVLLCLPACGYRLLNGPSSQFKGLEVAPTINLTPYGRVSTMANAYLKRLLGTDRDTKINRRVQLFVREELDTPLTFDRGGFTALSRVVAIVELKLSTKEGTEWSSGPVRTSRAFARGRGTSQSELARQDAFRRAVEAGIIDAVELLARRFETVAESESN